MASFRQFRTPYQSILAVIRQFVFEQITNLKEKVREETKVELQHNSTERFMTLIRKYGDPRWNFVST